MSVSQFGLSDPGMRARYDALFDACESAFIQQSTSWAEIIQNLGPDEPIFLLCTRDGVDLAGLPLYLYRHPLGNVLNSVPQAGPLGGIFARAGLAEDLIEGAYRELVSAAEALAGWRDCLSFTLISNPFSPDTDRYGRYFHPTYVLTNFAQYTPVPEIAPEGRVMLQDSHRRNNLARNLRRAEQAGVVLESAATSSPLDEWYEIHLRRHRELGVAPLPRALFSGILDTLGPRGKAELLLARLEGKVISGCMYIRHRAIQDVFLLAMDSSCARFSPNYLITDHSIRRAAASGVRIYNWQSSPDRQGGVYRYKEQWGAREASYSFLTLLLCPTERIARLGPDVLRKAYSGHFVVPYGVFTEGFDRRTFKKADAARNPST